MVQRRDALLPQASDIFYFLEVAGTLNISRAAERLGITQPSLSIAIQRLEHNIGAPLLIRNRSGVKLTKVGQRLSIHAKGLMIEWDRLRTDALRQQEDMVGRFSIGCHPSIAIYGVVDVLADLFRKYPGVDISLVHDPLSRKITEEVISFKIDIGVVINPVSHPELVIKQIGRDDVGLWVADDKNPLQNPSSGQAVLAYAPELSQSDFLLRKFAKQGIKFARTVTTTNLEVLSAIVASGAAAGILPGRVARRVTSPKLKLYRKDFPSFSDRICLVYRADNMTGKAGKVIMKAIEDHLISGKL